MPREYGRCTSSVRLLWGGAASFGQHTGPMATDTRATTSILGSVGGFFAGGFLGAHIEGDRCNCDDPGVRGFLIGAPIGALAGVIVGGKLLF